MVQLRNKLLILLNQVLPYCAFPDTLRLFVPGDDLKNSGELQRVAVCFSGRPVPMGGEP